MKRSTLIQIGLFLLLALVSYLYITRTAIKTERITLPSQVITVVDTVETVKIEERWRTRTEYVRDTAFVVRPDTVLIGVGNDDGSAADLSKWKEWILRIMYRPPVLEMTTHTTNDSTRKYYVYREVPWGFLVEPNSEGTLSLQILRPRDRKPFLSGYNWGPGYELGAGLALYGSAWAEWRGWRLTGVTSIHLKGLRAGLYISW